MVFLRALSQLVPWILGHHRSVLGFILSQSTGLYIIMLFHIDANHESRPVFCQDLWLIRYDLRLHRSRSPYSILEAFVRSFLNTTGFGC
jgi:hypothetical protein